MQRQGFSLIEPKILEIWSFENCQKIRLCIDLCRSLWTSHLHEGINVEPSYFVYATTRGWRCATSRFQFDRAKILGNMERWKLPKNTTLYRFMQEFVDITSTWRNQCRAFIFCIRNNQRLKMCNVKVSVWSSQNSWKYGALKIAKKYDFVWIYAGVCGHHIYMKESM